MAGFRSIADQIVGPPDGRHMDPSVHRDAYDALCEIGLKLDELMQNCAQEMYDDVSGAGEQADALRDVAEIFGIEGPHPRLDRLYEAD